MACLTWGRACAQAAYSQQRWLCVPHAVEEIAPGPPSPQNGALLAAGSLGLIMLRCYWELEKSDGQPDVLRKCKVQPTAIRDLRLYGANIAYNVINKRVLLAHPHPCLAPRKLVVTRSY